MVLRVQSYAGRKADERPVRFQLGDREYVVEEVLDQWYGPDTTFFKVRADDDNMYILSHSSVRRLEMAEAHAALAIPSLGNPSQPRISAGVTANPMTVETASASSGVTVSPTPRIIAVSRMKTKVNGMVIIMMRA